MGNSKKKKKRNPQAVGKHIKKYASLGFTGRTLIAKACAAADAEAPAPVQLARPGEGQVTVRPHVGDPLLGTDYLHDIHDEAGNKIGNLWVTPKGDTLHINHIGAANAEHGFAGNSLGAGHVRSIFRQLKTMYPGTTRITGTRVSGAALKNPGMETAVNAPVKLDGSSDHDSWISQKIATIMRDGIKGKKVSQKQAVAVAYAMHKKLARITPDQRASIGHAQGALQSSNQDSKADLARQVMREAALRASVRPAIAGDLKQARPSQVIAVTGHHEPEHVNYAASWYGLLSQEPALTVFHPGEGSDTLHIIDSPHPADLTVDYFRRAGVPRFAVESRGAAGSRAYIQHNDDLTNLARGLNGRHTSVLGTATRISAGPTATADANARADYRSRIRDAEQAASTGPVT